MVKLNVVDVTTSQSIYPTSIDLGGRRAQSHKGFLPSEIAYLHCDDSIVDHHLFGQKICADSCLVLVGKLLVDVLVHQRRLTHARITQYDHFQQNLLPGRHDRVAMRVTSDNYNFI